MNAQTKTKMTPFVEICEEMNDYINKYGQIPRNTFIKKWHDLNNVYVAEAMHEAHTINSTTSHWFGNSLKRDIKLLSEHMERYSHLHDNIANPHMGAKLPGAATKVENQSVKTVFWRTMMQLREYYCRINGIDLPNDDSSIGKLNRRGGGNGSFGDIFE